MVDLLRELRLILVRDLETFIREVELYPDDELIWKTVPGISNSTGNLALHVRGNLQHFIGAILGGTGYVRNREDELGRRAGSRAELARELRQAIAAIDATFAKVTE